MKISSHIFTNEGAGDVVKERNLERYTRNSRENRNDKAKTLLRRCMTWRWSTENCRDFNLTGDVSLTLKTLECERDNKSIMKLVLMIPKRAKFLGNI